MIPEFIACNGSLTKYLLLRILVIRNSIPYTVNQMMNLKLLAVSSLHNVIRAKNNNTIKKVTILKLKLMIG